MEHNWCINQPETVVYSDLILGSVSSGPTDKQIILMRSLYLYILMSAIPQGRTVSRTSSLLVLVEKGLLEHPLAVMSLEGVGWGVAQCWVM